jgi:hypothetical protein
LLPDAYTPIQWFVNSRNGCGEIFGMWQSTQFRDAEVRQTLLGGFRAS